MESVVKLSDVKVQGTNYARNRKLTIEQVEKLQAEYKRGASMEQLASEYDVTLLTIKYWVSSQAYRDNINAQRNQYGNSNTPEQLKKAREQLVETKKKLLAGEDVILKPVEKTNKPRKVNAKTIKDSEYDVSFENIVGDRAHIFAGAFIRVDDKTSQETHTLYKTIRECGYNFILHGLHGYIEVTDE